MSRYYRGGGYHRKSRGSGDGGMIGCLAIFLLAIFALPFLGLYLLSRKDAGTGVRVLGGVLFFGGLILWIYLGVKGASS